MTGSCAYGVLDGVFKIAIRGALVVQFCFVFCGSCCALSLEVPCLTEERVGLRRPRKAAADPPHH